MSEATENHHERAEGAGDGEARAEAAEGQHEAELLPELPGHRQQRSAASGAARPTATGGGPAPTPGDAPVPPAGPSAECGDRTDDEGEDAASGELVYDPEGEEGEVAEWELA